MSEALNSRFLDDPEFQSLLVGCMESLERGETIDRAALAKDFPKFAGEIGQFLDDRKLLEKVASDFGDVDPSRVAISAYEPTMASGTGADDFAVGDTVRYIGEYEILEEIARGGMGVVFKARQQKLKRIVALKMILAGRLADSTDVERFQREARAAGKLKHPCIVPVHEIGEHDSRHYFTMDYVERRSLAEAIREETLAPRAAAKLVQATAGAVQYAHEQGIVHRDLKPANILLDRNSQPQVTDFGLARMLESVDEESRAELTASGQILGTPSYMSPEQASGKQDLVGPASDIYSLGAILYASLTGRAPFVTDSPVDTLLQVMKNEPVSPQNLNPSVPRDLETICLKCLTKESHKRYGTAQELADDLGRFLEGRPVLARPVGTISKTVRWCRRNKVVASLLGLVFASMAAGTAISAFYAKAANEHAENEAVQRIAAEESRQEAEAERDSATKARRLAEQRGDALRRQLYIAEMPRSQDAWDDGNVARVMKILQQHVPRDGEEDLRGFEWHYLKGLTESSLLTIDTGREVRDAAISPDGSTIAIVGAATLSVHSLETGESAGQFPLPPAGSSFGLSYDSSGDLLCVDSGRTWLWNLQSKELVWVNKGPYGCIWCAFTPDDSRIVTAGNNWEKKTAQIQVRAADDGELLREIPIPTVIYAAALAHSGETVFAACHDNRVREWDVRTGGLVKEWACPAAVVAMTFAPDGRFLLFGNGDGRLERHDAISGKRLHLWGNHRTAFNDLVVDAAGDQFAAAGSSQIVHLFDAKTGEPIKEFRGHAAEIVDVQYRPGFHELVSCDRSGVVHVWDSRSKQGILPLDGVAFEAADVAFSPDSRWFACAEGISWNRERKGAVRLLDLNDGTPGPVLDGHENGAFGVAFTETQIFSAGEDGRLVTWDLGSFEQVRTRTFDQPLSALAVSGNKDVMAIGTWNGDVIVLDDPEAEPAMEFQAVDNGWEIDSVAVSPDGRFVAGASTRDLRVRDWRQDKTVLDAQGISSRAVAFDSTGQQMAAASNGNVIIYDTETWKVIHEIKAHSQPIAGLAFHPSSTQLATRSVDGTLKLWETNTWQNLLTRSLAGTSQHDRHDPVFSQDGRFLVADRDGEQLKLIRAQTRSRRQ